MDKKRNFKLENEKRKLKIHEKMKNGDMDEINKFVEICMSPDEEEQNIINQKMENILNKLNEELSLEFIKELDCTIIDEDLFEMITYTEHIKDMWQVGLYSELDGQFYVIPLILQLEDNTEIKLLCITEVDEYDDEDEDE